MATDICSVCAGEGIALSGPCICGGLGTASAEADGLRTELAAERDKRERYREALERISEADSRGRNTLGALALCRGIAREALQGKDHDDVR